MMARSISPGSRGGTVRETTLYLGEAAPARAPSAAMRPLANPASAGAPARTSFVERRADSAPLLRKHDASARHGRSVFKTTRSRPGRACWAPVFVRPRCDVGANLRCGRVAGLETVLRASLSIALGRARVEALRPSFHKHNSGYCRPGSKAPHEVPRPNRRDHCLDPGHRRSRECGDGRVGSQ